MHPLQSNRMRTMLYFPAWAQIAVMLTWVVARGGTIGGGEAALIVFPMCALYAFVCPSAWYLCNAMPLRQADSVRLATSQITAAIISAGAWVVLGWVWASLAGTVFNLAGLQSRYLQQVWVLFVSGLLLFGISVTFSYLLIAYEESKRAESKALELQVLAREAELKALRAQIDPHFLFNSLNSINALVMTHPEGARNMCVLLADFLRGSLKLGSKERIPLAEELQLAEYYLDIERVRLGSRLRIERDIDPQCETCLVPPLIMQPLVENAITHGVSRAIEGGVVSLHAEHNGAGVKIVIENPFEVDDVPKNGAGLGLQNVKMRLSNLYNGDARIDVTQNAGVFHVELQLPCEKNK